MLSLGERERMCELCTSFTFALCVENFAPGEARTRNPGIAQSANTVYKYRALTDCATGAC